MSKIFAIGDIHGCYNELKKLFDNFEKLYVEDKKDWQVVFIGDYIDRGPDTKKVFEFLKEIQTSDYDSTFLMGNHEQMMLDSYDKTKTDQHKYMWLFNGGANTLDSFNSDITEPNEDVTELLTWFRNNLQLTKTEGRYLFVHAGIFPFVPLSEQTREDYLWIRDDFLQYDKPFENNTIVVHGHTPFNKPRVNNRINVDMGCVFGGELVGLVIQDDVEEIIKVESEQK